MTERTTMLRMAKRPAVAVALMTVLLLTAACLWLSSGQALQWLTQQASSASGGNLAIESATGSLARDIRVERLRYTGDGFLLEAEDITLRWQPLALLLGEIRFSRLAAGRIRYTGTGDAPATMPAELGLPFRLALPAVEIAHLEVNSLPVIRQVNLQYFGGKKSHEINLAGLRAAGWNLGGEMRTSAQPPFATTGTLRARGAVNNMAAAITAGINGTLGQLQTDAVVESKGGSAKISAAWRPYAAQPLDKLMLRAEQLDLGAWHAGLPHTRIDVQADAGPSADHALRGTLQALNTAAGSFETGKLPLKEATLAFSGRDRHWQLSGIDLRLPGGGQVHGDGVVGNDSTRVDLSLKDVDPSQLHGRLRSMKIGGPVTLSGDTSRQTLLASLQSTALRAGIRLRHEGGKLFIDQAQLRALDGKNGGNLDFSGQVALNPPEEFSFTGKISNLDPSQFLQSARGTLNGNINATGRLQPSWQAQIQLSVNNSMLRGAPFSASARFSSTAARPFAGEADAGIGPNRVTVSGNYGQPQDRLLWTIAAPDLGAIDSALAGAVRGRGSLAGTVDAPVVELSLAAERLAARGYGVARLELQGNIAPGSDGALRVKASASGAKTPFGDFSNLEFSSDGSRSRHVIHATLRGKELDAGLRAIGGLDPRWRWAGTLEQLEARGAWPLRLTAPANIAFGPGLLTLEQLHATTLDGEFGPVTIRADRGKITTTGTFRGIAAARLLPRNPALDARSLRLGGRWNLVLGDTFSGSAEVRREQGDLALTSGETIAAGLRTLALNLSATDNNVEMSFNMDSGNIGAASARISSRVAKRDGQWLLPGDAALAGNAAADMRSLAWLRLLMPELDRVSGSLKGEATLSGSVASPRFSGTLNGDGIALRALEPGVDLRNGRLRAALEGNQLRLDEFRIDAGKGQITAAGSADITGGLRRLDITAEAERAQIIASPQLSVIISGKGRAGFSDLRLALEGDFRVDEGSYDLGGGRKPALGNDVVIKTASNGEKLQPSPLRIDLNVGIDLNNRFTIRGYGLDALLGGAVRVATRKDDLAATGTVRTVRGKYLAFGQPLDIERGALLFSGPLTNPGIDLRAVRKIQTVEVGVEVIGSLQRPVVKLVSTPDMPDSDRLSWLALGRDPQTASGKELAMLQAAALSMAGSGDTPLQRRIAGELGLDEIGLTQGSDGSHGALALGKQITSKITIRLEQTLGGTAGSLLRIDYLLSDRWRLRGTTGAENAGDILFSLRFD